MAGGVYKKAFDKGKQAFAKGKEAYQKNKPLYDKYKAQYKELKAGGQQTPSPAPRSEPEPSWFAQNGKFILLGAGALLVIGIVATRKH